MKKLAAAFHGKKMIEQSVDLLKIWTDVSNSTNHVRFLKYSCVFHILLTLVHYAFTS